jgi:hypothetical protein
MNDNWRDLLHWDCDDFQVSHRHAAVKTPDNQSFYRRIIVNRQKFYRQKGVSQKKKLRRRGSIVEIWYYPMVSTKPT